MFILSINKNKYNNKYDYWTIKFFVNKDKEKLKIKLYKGRWWICGNYIIYPVVKFR